MDSKRDIRKKLTHHPFRKDIIKTMYPNFVLRGSAYEQNISFISKIRNENRWKELDKILTNY